MNTNKNGSDTVSIFSNHLQSVFLCRFKTWKRISTSVKTKWCGFCEPTSVFVEMVLSAKWCVVGRLKWLALKINRDKTKKINIFIYSLTVNSLNCRQQNWFRLWGYKVGKDWTNQEGSVLIQPLPRETSLTFNFTVFHHIFYGEVPTLKIQKKLTENHVFKVALQMMMACRDWLKKSKRSTNSRTPTTFCLILRWSWKMGMTLAV